MTALAIAPDGALWAGVDCSVQRNDGIEWQTLAHCGKELPQGNILGIAFTPDGTAWVANGFSLASYDGSTWNVRDMLANTVFAAPEGAPGMEGLWVNGWEGMQDSWYVARVNRNDWEQYPVADSFPGSFSASAVTPDGQLCGLNPGQGLACFDGGDWPSADAWTIYDRAMGLNLGEALGPPVAAPDGALWVHTPSGLARLDAPGTAHETWTLYPLDPRQAGVWAGPLAFRPKGEFWIGTTRFRP